MNTQQIDAGRAFRAAKKAKYEKQLRATSENLVEQFLQRIAAQPGNKQVVDEAFEAFGQACEAQCPRLFQRKFCHNALATAINHFNKAYDANVEGPPIMVTIKRHRALRDFTWHEGVYQACETATDFIDWVNRGGETIAAEDWPVLIAYAATLFGGVNDPHKLDALLATLPSKPSIQWTQVAGESLYWMELTLPKARICNVAREDEAWECTKLWFIDPLTLALIQRYYREAAPLAPTAVRKQPTKQRIIKLLRSMGLAPSTSLVKHSAGFSEALPGVDLNQALLHHNLGLTPTAAMPVAHWQLAVTRRPLTPVSQLSDLPPVSTPRRRPKNDTSNHCAIAAKGDPLHDALHLPRQKKESDEGLAIRRTQRFLALDIDSQRFATRTLIAWLRDHLTTRGNTISTVLRYYDEVAGFWMVADDEIDLATANEDELEAYFSEAIEKLEKPDMAYFIGRFHDLYAFSVKHYDLPDIELDCEGWSHKRHVKAAYIPLHAYHSALATLARMEDFHTDVLTCLRLITIIAYRTGLRISEILNLRLDDVEHSPQGYVLIRRRTKTASSKRSVPFGALLTPSEYAEWCAWCSTRRHSADAKKYSPIFAIDGDDSLRLNRDFVSQTMIRILRGLTGISDYVFHSFRHTALSNLQLVIEREWSLASIFTGWDSDQIERLFTTICRRKDEKVGIYWALSRLAGHESPDMTLRTYLHFSELLAAVKLSRNELPWARDGLRFLTGFTPTLLSRRTGKSTSVCLNAGLRHAVHDSLNNLGVLEDFSPQPLTELSLNPMPAVTVEYPLYRVYATLRRAEEAGTLLIDHLSLLEGIPAETLQRWFDNAKELLGRTTRKKQSRIISPSRENDDEPVLTPAKIRAKVEKEEGTRLAYALEDTMRTFPDQGQRLIEAIDYYYHHSTTSNSGIRFRDPAKLKSFLTAFDTPLVASAYQWRAVVRGADVETLKPNWRDALDYLADVSFQPKRQSKQVTVYLHYRHPHEDAVVAHENNDFQKHSFRAVRYVFFIFLVKWQRVPIPERINGPG